LAIDSPYSKFTLMFWRSTSVVSCLDKNIVGWLFLKSLNTDNWSTTLEAEAIAEVARVVSPRL